jgi:hypothetical protein
VLALAGSPAPASRSPRLTSCRPDRFRGRFDCAQPSAPSRMERQRPDGKHSGWMCTETSGVIPDVHYARTPEGVHIAYLVIGDGQIDVVYPGWGYSNIEYSWRLPDQRDFLRKIGSIGRLIYFDPRGMGLSDKIGSGSCRPSRARWETSSRSWTQLDPLGRRCWDPTRAGRWRSCSRHVPGADLRPHRLRQRARERFGSRLPRRMDRRAMGGVLRGAATSVGTTCCREHQSSR